MKVTMAEVNKKANLIINQVANSGETVIILKHGKPIAEIRPITSENEKDKALIYLAGITPLKVAVSPDNIIETGRKRGI